MSKNIQYSFVMPDDSRHNFVFSLNTETFEIETNENTVYPEWTELNFCRCSHCPLTDETHCPVAVNVCNVVLPLGSILSFETVTCWVVTPERKTSTTTSAQDALRSMMLFVMATSACPYTDFLKPMARFHLPFPTLEETFSRVVSTYRIYQYFRYNDGLESDQGFDGLFRLYQDFEVIILAIAQRLKAGNFKGDAGINALVIIHSFSQFIPMFLNKDLEILRPAFEPLLKREIDRVILSARDGDSRR